MANKTFKYQLEIQEKTEFEANLKMQAAITLIQMLPTNMLTKMAHVAKYEPAKIKMAANFLGV